MFRTRNIINRLTVLLVSIAIVLTTMSLQPIEVYAVGLQEAAQIFVDAIGSSGKGGTSTIVNGVTYRRTGYMCYLVQADGGLIPGMQAHAFTSKGYSQLSGSVWSCKSKKGGYTVSSWRSMAPWEVTPFNDNKSTNVAEIKKWMYGRDNGKVLNAVQFVCDNWDVDTAQNYLAGEYVLVIETILNFQPHVKTGSSELNISYANIVGVLRAQGIVLDHFSTADQNKLVSLAKELYKKKYGSAEAYKAKGSPVIGTCSSCIAYEKAVGAQPSIFAEYTNNVACFAERIDVGGPGQKAGFEPWTGPTSSKISDDQVSTYGLAMLVIKAKDDAINTYWEPNGSPGDPEPAEPNKKGTCNIVKGYYKENITTGVKESLGVHYRLDCTNNIIISGEPNFELVEWRITDTLNTGVNPIAWNPSGTTTQTGKMATQVSLKVPEK